ncbi:MAG: hypothetical protein O2857_13335 [Planctomycetota bacterium]|nr:hypothetical protein [Planctomycetota bacterium]
MKALFVIAILMLLPLGLQAEEAFKPRETMLSANDQYVVVDLTSVANDLQPLTSPSSRIEVNRIPFELLAGDKANCLFMKPIGWAGGKDEAREYPGYIANYDKMPTAEDKTRALVQIPVADYRSVWLLAAADDDESLSNVLSLRFGVMGGQARTTYHDFEMIIPRAGEKVRPGTGGVVRIIPHGNSKLYLIQVPLGKAIAQDFKDHWSFILDITKKLDIAVNLPDPYRYQIRPVGDPSGVRIFAMTLDRSSMQMEVASRELGNVYNQPQKPTFDVLLRNHYEHYLLYHLEALARRDDGKEERFTFEEFRPWSPVHKVPLIKQTLELPVTERGHYELKIELMLGKQRVLYYDTTFAVLSPDTRKYRHESPFGTWDFAGTHSTPADEDLVGQLTKKAGLRFVRKSEKYGLEPFSVPGVHNEKSIEHWEKAAKESTEEKPPRFLIFHETAISGPQITRVPETFTGKEYRFSESETKRFDELWNHANAAFAMLRNHYPDSEVYFGNGVPHTLEAFCKRGLSKEYLKIAGNECGSFMRPPETQPLDYVANNAGIWMFRQILDHYGYKDTKVYQCYEVGYPNTNPGNLSYETQSRYFVRHFMHSLAWRIPIMTFGCVSDMANSYYHSNWGASGFCFAYPNVSPKKSYVGLAVLTQLLDGASFVRAVPTGSPVVYALEFKRRDRQVVTCLWTTRGKRELEIEAAGRDATLVEIYGRDSDLKFKSRKATIEVGIDPLYVITSKPMRSLAVGRIIHSPMPEGEQFLISKLDKIEDWAIEQERSLELEVFNFMCPRRRGNFQYRNVASMEGRENVIQVRPTLPVEGSVHLPMYSTVRVRQPVEIPGKPTEIGLWVYGNGGWGRVIFELEDASGQRWISIGAEMGGEPNPWMADWMPKEEFEKLRTLGGAGISDWNSNDAWGRGYINHEGWRYLTFPLPGQYGNKTEDYHWPRNSQWRFSGDGMVKYPLKFKSLSLAIPEKVLYLTQYEAVPRQEIYLQSLTATYAPINESFARED